MKTSPPPRKQTLTVCNDFSSSASIATAASTSFQLRSYHEECTEDKQQRKQTFVLTSSNSTLPSTRTMNCVKRGQFQRVPL